jgi:hypothetical protein
MNGVRYTGSTGSRFTRHHLCGGNAGYIRQDAGAVAYERRSHARGKGIFGKHGDLLLDRLEFG